jgi:creatinine amidohydrolase
MGPEWKIDPRLYLPYMTREAAREAVADNAVLLVPAATIEQHGDHGPLHTDIDNVLAVCLATAEEVDADVRCVVAAPVWFTISPFDPAQFPGSMRMREDVFKEALGDILESYLFGGFKKVAVVNGHGGGTEWQIPDLIFRLLRKESHLFPDRQIPPEAHVITFEWTALLEVFAQKELEEARGCLEGCTDWHGGDIETGMQLYLRPGLVDMAKAVPGDTMQPLEFAPWDIGHSWYYQYIIAEYWGAPSTPGEQATITGRPDLATAEAGKRVLDLAAKVTGRFVREWAGRSVCGLL